MKNNRESFFISDINEDENNKKKKIKVDLIEKDNNDLELKELESIAESVGIPKFENKNELIERINQLSSIQEQFIKEKQMKEKLNPFENHAQKLAITENLEKGEIHFWKVFKNKFLFKKIFSNFIFKHIHRYDQLVNIILISMGYKNGEAILKDKVKSKSYLAFDTQINDGYNGFFSICETITKDNQENRNFYKMLFENYRYQFEELLEISMLTTLKSNNNMAFEQFIESFKIDQDRITLVILQHYVKTEIININKYEKFKMFNYILSKYPSCIFLFGVNVKFLEFGFLSIDQNPVYNLKLFLKIFKSIQKNPKFYEMFYNILPNDIESIKESLEILHSNLSKENLQGTILNNLISFSKSSKDSMIISKNKRIKKSIITLANFYSKLNKNQKKVDVLHDELYQFFYLDENDIYKDKKELLKFKDKINYAFIQHDHTYINNILSMVIALVQLEETELLGWFLEFSSFIDYYRENEFFRIKLIKSIDSTKVLDYFYENQKYRDILFQDRNQNYQFFLNSNILEYYEGLMIELGRKMLVESCYYTFSNLAIPTKNDQILISYLIRIANNQSLSKVYEVKKDGVSFETFSKIIYLAVVSGKQDLVLELFKTGIFKTIDLREIFNYITLYTPRHRIAFWVFENMKSLPTISFINFNTSDQINIIEIESKYSGIKFHFNTSCFISLLTECGKFKECYQQINKNNPHENFSLISEYHRYKLNNKIIKHFFDKLFQYYKENPIDLTGELEINHIMSKIKRKVFVLLNHIIANGNIEAMKYVVLNYSQIFKINTRDSFLTQKDLIELLKQIIDGNFIELLSIFLIYIKIEPEDYQILENEFKEKEKNCLGWKYLKKKNYK